MTLDERSNFHDRYGGTIQVGRGEFDRGCTSGVRMLQMFVRYEIGILVANKTQRLATSRFLNALYK